MDPIRYASGFLQCSAACDAGSCCYSSHEKKSCSSTHEDVCALYQPCTDLSAFKKVHGSPVDLVKQKCSPLLMTTEIGIDDCENACQSRSCCFAKSKKNSCYEDNKVCMTHFQGL